MPTLEDAILLATQKHAGQKDKAGEAYILHPLRVMFRVRDLGGSETAQIAAVLHDVIEDCNTSASDLRDLGYPEEVLSALDAVTKRPHEHGTDQYLSFVRRAAIHPIGRLIKYADLEDNLNPRRLKQLSVKDLDRYNRYLEAWKLVTSQ
jgi:hypothetical protein